MKIKKTILTDFLNKVNMTGAEKLNECLLKFSDKGLEVAGNSANTTARVDGWLKKSAFKEYENIGNIGITDLEMLVKIIKRFGDYVTLSLSSNLLSISSEGKSVEVEVTDEKYIKEDTGAPKVEFDETFEMGMAKLKDIFEDAALNKDCEIYIETKEKGVMFYNTGKYKFKTTHEAVSVIGGHTLRFGEPLINAAKNLTNNLQLNMGNNTPLKIIETTDESVITIFVAPRAGE